MNDEMIILKSKIEIADKHSERMIMAFERLQLFFPLTLEVMSSLSMENLGYLEILTNRFAKLQDFIGGQIFSSILEITLEKTQGLSMIDRLNLLEKSGFLESVQMWSDMLKIRNNVAHEYPEDSQEMMKHLVRTLEQARILLDYWQFLKQEMDQRIFVSIENND